MNWDGKYWRGVFSEQDGTPSSSRVAFAVTLCFALGWVTAILWVHLVRKVEPVITRDMLDGFAAFIVAGGGAYGVNRVAGIFGKNGP